VEDQNKDTDLEKLLVVGRTVKKKQYADLIAKAGSGLAFTADEMRLFERLHKEFEEEGQAPPTRPALPSQTAVVSYLKNQGYRASGATINRHYLSGLLKAEDDGSFIIAKVDAFALEHLKRRDGSQKGAVDDAYKLRITEETRKLHAQADHWEIRAKEAAGDLVLKSFALDEIAAREIVFKSDLTNQIYTSTPVECAVFEGNPDKIPDVIALRLAALDRILGRFTGDREYTVELPPPKPEPAPRSEEEFEEEL
jgi:hypothetical protein